MKGAHARVITVAGRGLSSRLIEWRSDGWSHSASVLSDGTILDSRSDVVEYRGQCYPTGVQRRPRGYLEATEPKYIVIDIPCTMAQLRRRDEWLISQEGKPYDFVGIRDFVTGSFVDRNWREESAWFCTELMVASWEYAGICPPLATPVYKLEPGDGVILALALGGRIVKSKGLRPLAA